MRGFTVKIRTDLTKKSKPALISYCEIKKDFSSQKTSGKSLIEKNTDEINGSGGFFNNPQGPEDSFATRRIFTFEFGAVLN